ncbi:MAG TPA: carbohydrate ABC transporter permease [Bacillota bacterium]|nr:carbohydrate ABC transporter permease [Bacillota bacterium]HOB43090.1 carbohydrate ABC transporter permease [Bacillota bacterium]HOO29896.1 carbohydrate ABC transporter permease [Bacillota bacterium]HPZ14111.1 carbohydrate ABC transporter permease [Bacillota bacterium]HQD80778.1 carbohydrate ABC transporter permease [Bacillota bacterium]
MWQKAICYVFLTLAGVVVFFPIYYAIATSFFTPAESLSYPPTLFPSKITLVSYEEALRRAPVFRFILNSFIVSASVMFGQLITASLAAYSFSFLEYKGRQVLFYIVLSTMMVPWEVTIISNYLTIKALNWTDTYLGLSVPFMASAFGIFLLRQGFMTIPRELKDAAEIDGCSDLRFFTTIVLPLSRPMMATLAVYTFLNTYNQYLWPLLVTNVDRMRTVQIGLAMLQWDESVAWNSTMAGVVMVLVPTAILMLFGHKQLVSGLTSGALKG